MTETKAVTVADQDALVDKWLTNAPANTVIQVGEYSPNGSPSQWEYYVPSEQEGPDLTTEQGDQCWDWATLSEDGLMLEVARCPERSQHVYRTYSHTPAEEVTGDILIAWQGPDSRCVWRELGNLSEFLTDTMQLDTDSDGYKLCMVHGLEESIRSLE